MQEENICEQADADGGNRDALKSAHNFLTSLLNATTLNLAVHWSARRELSLGGNEA